MPFGIRFAALQQMLMREFTLTPVDEQRLVARLRNMQRDGFPQGVNVGRGLKVAYTIEQTAAVLFLHSLVEEGFTPDFAIRLFKEYRGPILRVACQAVHVIAEPPEDWPGPTSRMLVLRGSLLGQRNDGAAVSASVAATLEGVPLMEYLSSQTDLLQRPGGFYAIDFAARFAAALNKLIEDGHADHHETAVALEELAASLPAG